MDSAAFNYAGISCLWIMEALVVLFLVWFYANRKTPWFVHGCTFIGWLFPFMIVLLLPLDLTSSKYEECLAAAGNSTATAAVDCDPPVLFVSESFLWVCWRTIYWTMFCLTWFMLPIVQGYFDSGYFTAWERIKKALRANLIYYAIVGSLGIVVLIWIAIQKGFKDPKALQGFVMALANLFGLSLVVVFLSHGLIEVPRALWYLADRKRTLRYYEFRVPKIKDALQDAQVAFDELAKEVHAISRRVRFHDDLRPYVDIVLEKCPLSEEEGDSGNHGSARPGEGSPEYANLDLVKLARLHKDLIRAVREKERCEWEWRDVCGRAFLLQDILSCSSSGEMRFRSTIFVVPDGKLQQPLMFLKWLWYVHVEPLFLRFLAVMCALLSIVIIWSGTLYVVHEPIISVIGAIFHANGVSNALIEILSVVFLLYMCACAMHTLFKIKIFNRYGLYPNHHTTEISMCWFTSQMCRITFPLCYDFMNMAVNKGVIDPVFSKLMGEMDMAPVIGDFQAYIPIITAVIVFLNLFNVIERISRYFGFNDDLFDETQNNQDSWGDVEDGRLMLADAREKLERQDGDLRTLTSTTAPRNSTSRLLDSRVSRDSRISRDSPVKNETATKSTYKTSHPLYAKYANKIGGGSSAAAGGDSAERQALFSNTNDSMASETSTDTAPRSIGNFFKSISRQSNDSGGLMKNPWRSDDDTDNNSRSNQNSNNRTGPGKLANFDDIWQSNRK